MAGRKSDNERIGLIMRLTALILFVLGLLPGTTALGQTVSLSGKNMPLQQVFTEISKQTGYQFFYNDQLLKDANKLDIEVKNMSLAEVLDICFKNIPVSYELVGKTIILKETKVAGSTSVSPAINKVSGIVTDREGKPMPGASVVREGSKSGTSTNEQGFFSLDAKKGDILTVSYIGFVSETLKVASNPVSIQLERDDPPMEEMLVAGNVIAM